jgi:hypothetical protein
MTFRPMLINFFIYATAAQSTIACEGFGVDAIACSIPNGRACDVHIPAPQSGSLIDHRVIAHEMAHCYFGATH